MATNNFLIFDEQKQNILSDESYSSNQQRLSGVTQGIASSQLHNKQAYQASVMSNVLGRYISNHNLDATDSNATQLLDNFSQSIQSDVAQYSGQSLKDETGKAYLPVFLQYPNTYEKLGINGYYSPDGTKVFSILNSSTSGFTLKCTTPDGTEIYSANISYSTNAGTWNTISYIDDKYIGVGQNPGNFGCLVSYTDTNAQFVTSFPTGVWANYRATDSSKFLYQSDLYKSPNFIIAGNYDASSTCYLYSKTDGSSLGKLSLTGAVSDTSFGLCVTADNTAYALRISGANYYVFRGTLNGTSLNVTQLFSFSSSYTSAGNSQPRAASIYFYNNRLYIVVMTASNTYELREYEMNGTLVATVSIYNAPRTFIDHYLINGTYLFDLNTMSQINTDSYYGPYMVSSNGYALGTTSIGRAFLKNLTADKALAVSTSALPFLSSGKSPYACYFREVD